MMIFFSIYVFPLNEGVVITAMLGSDFVHSGSEIDPQLGYYSFSVYRK